eukprot:gene11948-8223_t
MPFDVRICDTLEDVCRTSLDIILSVTEANLKENRKTVLALSGGETPKTLYSMMARRLDLFKEKKAMTFIMGDDRLYPLDHRESNFYWATDRLLKHLDEDTYIKMNVDPSIATSESEATGEAGARAVAEDYERRLMQQLPVCEITNALNQKVMIPVIDVVLLGFGTDGHSASLFPNSIAVDEKVHPLSVSWPSPTMVPKVWRVTLTPHVIQHAKHVIVLVCREEKAWVVRGVLEDSPKGEAPVSRYLRDCKGTVHFVLDKGAAKVSESLPLGRDSLLAGRSFPAAPLPRGASVHPDPCRAVDLSRHTPTIEFFLFYISLLCQPFRAGSPRTAENHYRLHDERTATGRAGATPSRRSVRDKSIYIYLPFHQRQIFHYFNFTFYFFLLLLRFGSSFSTITPPLEIYTPLCPSLPRPRPFRGHTWTVHSSARRAVCVRAPGGACCARRATPVCDLHDLHPSLVLPLPCLSFYCFPSEPHFIPAMPFDVRICDTLEDVCRTSLDIILSVTEANLKENRKTVLALSGGETPKTLYSMMARRLDLFKEKKAMTFIMGDDRLYPLDHRESNFYWATDRLLKHLDEDTYIKMNVDPSIATSESEATGEAGARAVAEDYERRLMQQLPVCEITNALNQKVMIPVIDVVLLGFGTDGHSASLFPNSIAVDEKVHPLSVSWPSPTMVPKVWRVTLTPHVIQHAKHVIVLVCREEKAWVVRGVLEDSPKGEAPVSRYLRDCKGTVHFVLDKGAAKVSESLPLGRDSLLAGRSFPAAPLPRGASVHPDPCRAVDLSRHTPTIEFFLFYISLLCQPFRAGSPGATPSRRSVRDKSIYIYLPFHQRQIFHYFNFTFYFFLLLLRFGSSFSTITPPLEIYTPLCPSLPRPRPFRGHTWTVHSSARRAVCVRAPGGACCARRATPVCDLHDLHPSLVLPLPCLSFYCFPSEPHFIPAMPFDVRICDTLEDVCRTSLDIILSVTEANLKENRKTVLALSGGETPKTLYSMMARRLDLFKEKKAMTFIMGDDRLYPLDHRESNFYWATDRLLKYLDEDTYIKMNVDPSIATSESEATGEAGARAVAEDYERRLMQQLPVCEITNALNQKVMIPVIDVVLLGLGTDGHSASLFPNSIAVDEKVHPLSVSWPSPTMVPKVWRVTLTPHVIQHAKHVIVLVCHEEKARVVRGVLEDSPKGEAPVSRYLRDCKGTVHFVLDKGAAVGIPGAKVSGVIIIMVVIYAFSLGHFSFVRYDLLKKMMAILPFIVITAVNETLACIGLHLEMQLGPVKLASKNVFPKAVVPSPGSNGHLIIAHGLLGNAMNWATAARYLANHNQLQKCVHSMTSLDMRNHGASPHTTTHTNADLASDVELFALKRAQQLPATARQVLMGHSMGGMALIGLLLRRFNEAALLPHYSDDGDAVLFSGWKVGDQRDVRESMRLVNKEMGFSETFGLQRTLFDEVQRDRPNGAVTAAVVVDITPTISIGNDIRGTLNALCEVNMSRVQSYDDAHTELIRVGFDDKNTRDFLTTNIVVNRGGPATWRCNLPVLASHADLFQPTITQWFLGKKSRAVEGLDPKPCSLPVLFVFGEKSVYNANEARERIPDFFPNSQQVVIPGAGHFVHHEKPKEFAEAVAPFLNKYMA